MFQAFKVGFAIPVKRGVSSHNKLVDLFVCGLKCSKLVLQLKTGEMVLGVSIRIGGGREMMVAGRSIRPREQTQSSGVR